MNKELVKSIVREVLENRTDIKYIPDLDEPIADALCEKVTVNNRELEEIKKALDCCINPFSGGCRECPYNVYKHTCRYDLMHAVLNVIEEMEVEDDGKISDL